MLHLGLLVPFFIQFAMVRALVSFAWFALHFAQIGFEQTNTLHEALHPDGVAGSF
jgi:hypothetical protein